MVYLPLLLTTLFFLLFLLFIETRLHLVAWAALHLLFILGWLSLLASASQVLTR